MLICILCLLCTVRSAGGLTIAKDRVKDTNGSSSKAPATSAAAGAVAAAGGHAAEHHDDQDHEHTPHRLSERVTRMLTSIERELDHVERKIGKSMHVLDTDSDGVISADELANALSFLREQLAPEVRACPGVFGWLMCMVFLVVVGFVGWCRGRVFGLGSAVLGAAGVGPPARLPSTYII